MNALDVLSFILADQRSRWMTTTVMPPRKQRETPKVLLFPSKLVQTDQSLSCFLIIYLRVFHFLVRLTGRSHWACHLMNTHQSYSLLKVWYRGHLHIHATVQEHSLCSLVASSSRWAVCVFMLHLWPSCSVPVVGKQNCNLFMCRWWW
jgi:hypothetical protein